MNNFVEAFKARYEREPLLFNGVVAAVLALGVSFGLPLTQIQAAGVDSVLAAIALYITRTQVTPVADARIPANLTVTSIPK